MNILIIGSGGREHALAWQCAKDNQVETVYVAPGNAGTAIENKCENIGVDVADHQAVIGFCQDNAVDFIIVGPEAPLVAGLVDDCQAAGIKIWGPLLTVLSLKAQRLLPKSLCLKMAYRQLAMKDLPMQWLPKRMWMSKAHR